MGYALSAPENEKVMKKTANNLNRKTGKSFVLFFSSCALLCTSLYSVSVRAQADIHFSQFYETSILRNPALTGVFADDYKFGAYVRNQWSSISNPYQTALVSAETRVAANHMNDDFFSFGLLGYADKAGSIDQKITAVYPAINYNKSLDPEHNTYLSVGLTGGYLQYSFDPSKATFNNQYQNGHFDPGNPSLENLPYAKMNLWDVGAGVNFNTSTGKENAVTYVIGVSGYHFTQPNFSYYKIPDMTQNIRWNGNIGMSFNMTDDIAFMMQGNYAQQGTYSEILIGGLLSWTAASEGADQIFILSGGAFYRYDDAIIPVVKVKYKNMALGMSYDVNVSSLKDASRMAGGYEVTLFITGKYADKSGLGKKTVCPRF